MLHPDRKLFYTGTAMFAATTIILYLTSFGAAFGYAHSTTEAEVGYSGEARFASYLFGEEGKIVLKHVSGPAGWDIDVTPETIDLPPNRGYKYVQINGEYEKIVPVQIRVDVPTDVEEGTYTVSTVFKDRVSEEDSSSQLTVRQSQRFEYTVHVIAPPEPENTSEGLVERLINSASSAVSNLFGGGREKNDSTDDENADVPNKSEEGDNEESAPNTQDTDNVSSNTKENTDTNSSQNTPTGRITGSGLPVVQILIFIGIWGLVGAYVIGQRRGNQEARPWNDSIS